MGTTSESLLERAGVTAGARDPAVIGNVIERENGTIRFKRSPRRLDRSRQAKISPTKKKPRELRGVRG